MTSLIYVYDISFLVLFTLAVVIFLYTHRKNLKKDGIMYLYRTQVGIRFINYVGEKYKKTLTFLSYLAVISGYILMITMIYLFGQIVYIYLFVPKVVQAIRIPPIMPLIPYVDQMFKIDFLPPFYFTYWIVAIAVIAIFHEFSHGIIARRYGVKIKTTGFGFLGPFLAAFVEPDEKQMEKKPKFQQIAILSAGTFTNLILAILFFLVFSLFFVFAYAPAGALFNTYASQKVMISSITAIGGFSIMNHTNAGVIGMIDNNKMPKDLIIGENNSQLVLTKIMANNKTYFMDSGTLKNQLSQNSDYVILYSDLPAIENGIVGAIIYIDNHKINSQEDLSNVLKNYAPGDKTKIKTRVDEKILEYDITLAENPENKSKAMIGVGYAGVQRKGILGALYNFFNFFEKQATDYQPRFNADFVIFIKDLIWWLALINLSVALMNMLPMGIFDGGRMFMLTIWGITGSKKAGEMAFKLMTYILLGALLLIMLGWVLAMFGVGI
jgi:membrane-associated protease RseP (regulator of RpoE activity)